MTFYRWTQASKDDYFCQDWLDKIYLPVKIAQIWMVFVNMRVLTKPALSGSLKTQPGRVPSICAQHPVAWPGRETAQAATLWRLATLPIASGPVLAHRWIVIKTSTSPSPVSPALSEAGRPVGSRVNAESCRAQPNQQSSAVDADHQPTFGEGDQDSLAGPGRSRRRFAAGRLEDAMSGF